MTVGRLLQILKNRYRQELRKHSDARIPGRNLTKIPISIVPLQRYWTLLKGFLVDFGLIDADYVRIAAVYEIVQGVLVEDASYAVYVPHGYLYAVAGLAAA